MGAPNPTTGSAASSTILLDHTTVGEDVTLDCTATAGGPVETPPTRALQPGDELRARFATACSGVWDGAGSAPYSSRAVSMPSKAEAPMCRRSSWR